MVRRLIAEARDAAAMRVRRVRVGLRVRAAIVGGMALALAAAMAAGGPSAWIVVVLIGAGTMWVVVEPDGHIGLAVLLAFGWYWLAHVDARDSAWAVVAAAGLLVFHLAASAAALGPPDADLPPSLLPTWMRRCGAILGGTVALWLVSALISRADVASNVALTAGAVVVLAAVGLFALARSTPDAQRPGPRP